MKSFTKIIIPALALLFVFGSAFSQKKKYKDKDDDTVVTIKIDGKEQDIEAYFENWGEEFEEKMEKMFDHPKIHIDLDDDDFEIEFDDISIDIGDFAESIAEAVEEAITNMTIEIKDIDPNDLHHSNFDFDDDEDIDEMIDEIEDKYDSDVKNIDKMKIKIREDYVKIEMDVTLENGKKIDKMKIYAH
jgi:hypothetical protein